MSSGRRLQKVYVETTKNYRTGLKSAHGCLRGGGHLREIRIGFVAKNLSVLDRSSHVGDGGLHGVVSRRGSTVSTGLGLSRCIYNMNCFSARWDALTKVLLFQISLLFWILWSKNSSHFLINTTAAKTVNFMKTVVIVCSTSLCQQKE